MIMIHKKTKAKTKAGTVGKKSNSCRCLRTEFSAVLSSGAFFDFCKRRLPKSMNLSRNLKIYIYENGLQKIFVHCHNSLEYLNSIQFWNLNLFPLDYFEEEKKTNYKALFSDNKLFTINIQCYLVDFHRRLMPKQTIDVNCNFEFVFKKNNWFNKFSRMVNRNQYVVFRKS